MRKRKRGRVIQIRAAETRIRARRRSATTQHLPDAYPCRRDGRIAVIAIVSITATSYIKR